MIACLDVAYWDSEAVAACVLLGDWADAASTSTHVEHIATVEPYQPGQFYRRELPCLLAVLAKVREPVDVVVIDGYVWLAGEDRPGLGAHLYEALGRAVAVVGVAKTQFADAGAVPVLRGGSRKPLFVTAAGMSCATAAIHVQSMHGPHRIPDALKQVDQLCRLS